MEQTNHPELKANCFAYNPEKKKCDALSELVCTYQKCTFYKDKSEVDKNAIEKAIRHYSYPNQ